jgi:methionyl-tRNA formyltransferase
MLESSLEIDFVVLRYHSQDPSIEDMARDAGIDILTTEDVNSDDFIKIVEAYDCDIFVSMSFDQIFKERILSVTPVGVINCHAGMLPWYRGRNVLNWVLINDEPEFGITVHFVDGGIDTGDILAQRTYEITDLDTYGSLIERASVYCAELLVETLISIDHGEYKRTPQVEIDPFGFYCSKRGVEDTVIDWNMPSRYVFNFVRAMSPLPGALTTFKDQQIQIKEVEWIPGLRSHGGFPGAIVGISEDGFSVKTLDTYIRVVKWEGNFTPRIGQRLI